MTPGKLLLTFVFFPAAFLPLSSPQKRKKPTISESLLLLQQPPRPQQGDFAPLLTHFITTMG